MKPQSNTCILFGMLNVLLFFLILGSSCSNTRFLGKEDTLYVGNQIKVEDTAFSKSKRKEMESELSEIIHPRPNRSFLGLRFKLWVYNMAGPPKTNFRCPLLVKKQSWGTAGFGFRCKYQIQCRNYK